MAKVNSKKVFLVLAMRDGGMTDPHEVGMAANLEPKQVEDILAWQIEPSHPLRCATCGGKLATLPCVVCRMRGNRPRYRVTKSICREPV